MKTVLDKQCLAESGDQLVAHLRSPQGDWRVEATRAGSDFRVVSCSFGAHEGERINGGSDGVLIAAETRNAISFPSKAALGRFLNHLDQGKDVGDAERLARKS